MTKTCYSGQLVSIGKERKIIMSNKNYRIYRRQQAQTRRKILKRIADPSYKLIYHELEITDPKLHYSGTKYRGYKNWRHVITPFMPKEHPNVATDHIDIPKSSHNFNDDTQTIDGHHIANPLRYWNLKLNFANDDRLMNLVEQNERNN